MKDEEMKEAPSDIELVVPPEVMTRTAILSRRVKFK